MSDTIQVTVGALRVARSPDVLTAAGLGSCVAIILYDPEVKVGGLSHFILPHPSLSRDHSNPGKFPHTSVKVLLSEMEGMGARKERISARLVGGATMFPVIEANSPSIGMRNVDSAREVLAQQNIRVRGEDVGGGYARTVEFSLETGQVLVKSYQAGEKVL